MTWDELSGDQKIDFVIKHFDIEDSLNDLKDFVYQNIMFNDIVEEWYDPEDIINNQEWSTLGYNKKSDIIWKELDNDWGKDELIEFLVDHMTQKQIEEFKYFYEE